MRLQKTFILFQKNRYRHYYLCHYLPLGSGIDTVSRSLLKFKRGAQPDLDSWIDRSLRGFQETPISLPPATIILRALRHKEIRPAPDPPSPLDQLGLALSRQLHFPYLPNLLYKSRPTAVNQSLTRQQRLVELQNIYLVDPTALPPATTGILPATPIPATLTQATPISAISPPPTQISFLLLDDILTTGATILSILQTLLAAFPDCTVTIFTLAKTD